MKTALAPLALCIGLAGNAQIFTSGFENWVGVVPLDWLGEQTTISIDSVEQVDTEVHGGNHAVRLRHAPTGYTRFTTQVLHVDSGTTYTMSYWARGQGQVAAMLYDANIFVEFSPPNIAFETINSTSWELHSRDIQCRNTTDVGEFTFYVRNTVGPEYLVVDDVNVDLFVFVPPPFHTIQEIQTPTGGGDDSPLVDSVVATTGIVTGVCQLPCWNTYFLQNGSGPFSGVEVMAQTEDVAMGDEVTVYGTVVEYGSGASTNTRMEDVFGTIIGSTGNVDPEPQPLLASELEQEQWESVLVHVDDLEYSGPFADGWIGFGGSELVVVGGLFYTQSPTAGSFYSVTGVHRRASNDWRLEPRSAEDVVQVVGMDEGHLQTTNIYPNPASDVVQVDLGPSWSGAHYTITDATGRIVEQGPFLMCNAITIAHLPEGYYLLTLDKGRALERIRLVIKRV